MTMDPSLAKTPSSAGRVIRIVFWFTTFTTAALAFLAWFSGWLRPPCGYSLPELEQLHSAVEAVKEVHTHYPPCFAEVDVRERRLHLMRHLQVAYPNSTYGQGEDSFLKLRDAIRTPGGLAPGSQPYAYKNRRGEVALLDLNTLDPAESLVFWLGGFPTPCKADGTPVASYGKLFGFNKDRDDPFKRDSLELEAADPLRFRTHPYFDFVPERLVDNDDDGWLEYSPRVRSETSSSPPYVYFDAASYLTSHNDPASVGLIRYPSDAKLAEKWGYATPYLKQFAPERLADTSWQANKKFQIIAAGENERYGPTQPANVRRLVEIPSGRNWTTTDGKTFQAYEVLAPEERDNLTNVSSSTIGEMNEPDGM